MKKLLFLVLTAVSFHAVGQSWGAKKIARSIKKTAAFQQAHIAFALADVHDSKLLAHYQADHYMTPASNTKLLTFLAALQTFDRLPALQYFKSEAGNLHFTPNGYPLLLHPKYADTLLLSFLKDAQQWTYHPPKVDPNRWGDGWAWDDFPYYFAAEKSAFPIYGNVLTLEKTPSGLRYAPDIFTLRFLAEGDEIPPLQREADSNVFKINAPALEIGKARYAPFQTSSAVFLQALSHALDQPITTLQEIPEGAVWEKLYTQQESTLYKALLQDSDNAIAESLLLMIAHETSDSLQTQHAISRVTQKWESWLPDPLSWVDGSGVSRYNMFTPRTLVAVLQQLHKQADWKTLQDYFPQPLNSQPFLKNKLPYVYAKTGTLRHNHNLSGYLVSKKGNIYVFSLMVNHHMASTTEVKQGMALFLEEIYKKLR